MNKKIQNRRRDRSRSVTKQRFPEGWNEEKVRAVAEHYDRLTDEQLAQEIESAPEVREEVLISVPTVLLPAVRKLIAHHQKSA